MPTATTGGTFDWGALGALIAGGLAGGASGGQQPATQTTSNLAPWQIPYVQQGLGAASQLFSQGPQMPYPGSGVAPLSQVTTNAISGIADPANVGAYGAIRNYMLNQANAAGQQGVPMIGAANVGEQQYIDRSLGGQFLNANPYLDKTYEQAARGVMSGVGSQFASGGRLRSGASQRALTGGLGDLATNIYGQNYQQERDRMQQAAAMAQGRSGQINQIAQANQNAMMQGQQAGRQFGLQAAQGAQGAQDAIMRAYGAQQIAGGTLDQYGQSLVNDQMQRYQQAQQAPWQNISNYMGAVTGNYGGQTTYRQQSNPWANIFGGAATGLGLYGQLFGQGGG